MTAKSHFDLLKRVKENQRLDFTIPVIQDSLLLFLYQILQNCLLTEKSHFLRVLPIRSRGLMIDSSSLKVLIDLAKYKERPVDPADAQDCAVEIGAVAYVECSSLTQKNLKEVFDTAILASLQNHSPRNPRRGKKQKRWTKQRQAPNKMKRLSKSWWKRYCCVA